MTQATPERQMKSSDPFEMPISKQELQQILLAAIAHSATIGVAVVDQRLSFRAVNEAWAKMYGVGREALTGATIREVLGPGAEKFELAIRRVFSTGQPFVHYEFSAEIPAQTEERYWIASCFPVKDTSEKLKLAGAVVVEITHLRKLENWSHKLLQDSVRLLEALSESDQLLTGALRDLAKHGSSIKALPTEKMTPRELQVIRLLARNKSNKEVALELGISVRTVETHRTRIMLKLRIHSLSELVHYAIRSGIVEP
jgi:PAS domain S-box-containing protein